MDPYLSLQPWNWTPSWLHGKLQLNFSRKFFKNLIDDLLLIKYFQVKVPLFSARKDFKEVCARMGLQTRGTAGVDSASTGGTWDISNADRLGKSEVQLVNIFIEGTNNNNIQAINFR